MEEEQRQVTGTGKMMSVFYRESKDGPNTILAVLEIPFRLENNEKITIRSQEFYAEYVSMELQKVSAKMTPSSFNGRIYYRVVPVEEYYV